MKTVFSCLTQGCKNLSKYIVFSIFSLALLFVGAQNVGASNFTYDDYDNNTANHDSAVTSINGVIKYECTSNSSYTLIDASYAGDSENKNCVTYTSITDATNYVYYLQAQTSSNDDATTWNKITFKVHGQDMHTFIIVAEEGYSKSDSTTTDYDLYRAVSNGDGTYHYEYSQIRNKAGVTVQPDRVTAGKSGSASYAGGDYTFTYYLRNTEFREHNLHVYLYEGTAGSPDTLTPKITLTYTLAKPISDYKFNVDQSDDADSLTDACNMSAYEVCLNYTASYNTGATNNAIKTNTFTITMSKDAAFYFSTVTSHKIATNAVTKSNILLYNSIYATNTFYNDGATGDDKIVFYYYNFKDNTVAYTRGVTADPHYNFTLTIDANGSYQFFLTDIFGNTLTPDTFAGDDDTSEVKDVSNRTLSIYYLVYAKDASGNYTESLLEHGTNKVYGNNVDVAQAVRNFQLKDDSLDVLTNENVKIGLEFYSKVDIQPGYAVRDESTQEILQNPLYYTNSDSELRITNTTGGVNEDVTFFCRLASASVTADRDNVTCVTSGSAYTKQKLLGTQTIAENANVGKKAVSNKFNGYTDDSYFLGLLTGESWSSPANKNNRTNLVLNENGIFYVRIQDIHGNSYASTISVSIIDQHKPVITVNESTTELQNVICSNLYVTGAGRASNDLVYPTAKMQTSDCAATVVSYDKFAEVDRSTEMQSTIRVELKRSTTDVIDTNGFYNTDTSKATFSYADAIRMSLLRASDSVVVLGNYSVTDATEKKALEKSYYEKKDASYTSYGLFSRQRDLTTVTETTSTLERYNYGYQLNASDEYIAGSDLIIANNYTQYSSELKYYDADDDANKNEFVSFDVYEMTSTGAYSGTISCNSVADRDDNVCNNIVNAYIDKGINFKMVFKAHDYAGNEANSVTVEIRVYDNTAPGIANISEDGELLADPVIAADNIDTTCRLEIGSIIQDKSKLLRCYGFVDADTNVYKYVDNSTAYLELNTGSGGGYVQDDYTAVNFGKYQAYQATPNALSDIVYKYALSDQLYTASGDDAFDNHIRVYICDTPGQDACESGGWQEVENTTEIKFANAGNYEIKFEITDVGHNYITATGSQPSTQNKTVITLCYYVNPRVLLVRPLVKTVDYGSYSLATMTIDYCVYATTNTDSFFYNLFSLKYNASAKYKDTYDFVDKNYENEGLNPGESYGLVYCTNNGEDGTNAVEKTLDEVLANDQADIKGKLGITYATGDNKYNMEMTSYNAYLDAGYYYITMGDLSIGEKAETEDTNTFDENYVLRLHPSFLLDEKDPDDRLLNYNDSALLADDSYKYGVSQASKGETVSNVLYTVKQVKLTITANGGNKVYGTPDTNYPQNVTTDATINVSLYTDKASYVSTAGYLNGFTITGLVDNDYVEDFSDRTKDTKWRYDHIIKGYLRREHGEQVGTYAICNSTQEITGAGCSLTGFSIRTDSPAIYKYDLNIGGNVYYIDATGNKVQTVEGMELRYGMYIFIDSTYYKLTRNNTDLANKIFTNTMVANVWQYDYNDENYSIVIAPNDNNGNQNYYIEYVEAVYTIRPGEIIVQPGSNQGKEYSNPQHNDPRFEIVIYGESRKITQTAYGSSFKGFTETITDIDYPEDPIYTDDPYSNTANEKDTDLYFKERRTTTRELFGSATFIYQYSDVDLVDNKFTWMGTQYVYVASDSSVCLASSRIGSAYTQCQTMTIGVGDDDSIYKVAVNTATNKVTITTQGKLTYQTYGLLTNETETAGSATIVRNDNTNINVGWYSYVFTKADMHVVKNSKAVCSVSDYVYTPGTGTDDCRNYNLSWDDTAPSNELDSDNKVVKSTTVQGSAVKYHHNGNYYCGNLGSEGYSASCQSGTDEVTKIKFFIFKRDVIISFNAYQVTYGQVYSYFANGVFKIEDGTSSIPQYASANILTCYRKNTLSGEYSVNNVKYSPIDDDECNGVEHGISTGDTWGNDGLKLQFSLVDYIQNNFKETTYPVPAGKYYVFATIGTLTDGHWLHPNYNLVYVDFNAIKTGDSTNDVETVNGAVEVVSKDVTLRGTYYQKEYGQAKYNSYGANGSSLTATNVGSGAYSATLASMKSDLVNKIFDNHFYYCPETTGTYNGQNILVGCTMMTVNDGANNTNYGYGALNNIFGYTVADSDKDMVNLVSTGGNVDEIYANFAHSPIRQDLTNSNATFKDEYGLLSNVGFYPISLANIRATVAQYSGVTFVPETTILRYTNYSIDEVVNGGLYITPASIDIEVTPGQTKMYGCSYNSFNNTSVYTYKYGTGYTNCIESNGELYDLGYEYTVRNDKYEYLMNKVTTDATTSISTLDYTALTNTNNGVLSICALDARRDGTGCYDIAYPSATDFKYKVSPSTAADYSSVNFNKPTNTSLNSGALFRIPITVTSGAYEQTYSYEEYFTYATNAQATTNKIHQLQSVGNYALTLGNLDSDTNGVQMCGADSAPLNVAATYVCKNFIINYDGNNTAEHVYNGVAHSFNGSELTLSGNSLVFTITKRDVVLNTEYNYKIYGDTDPIEGFTCANLKGMFGLTTYTGRAYCTDDDTFIETGVTRFYAVDNSLAKAPWTAWSKDTQGAGTSYNTYNDILFDVIDSSSRIIREGEGTNAATRYDAGGDYYYIYKMVLNSSLNGANNYLIKYITGFDATNIADSTIGEITPIDGAVTNANVGFAGSDGAAVDPKLSRWYGDNAHACHSVANNGGNTSAVCGEYTGVETYNFYIDGIVIDESADRTYEDKITYLVTTSESTMVSEVYFEIVYREIYIQTTPVQKAYGNEEDYLDFGVTLVTPKDPSDLSQGYDPITYSDKWGDPSSLSRDDYLTFFPSDTFSLSAFAGTGSAAAYKGGVSDRAFGIYYYRTYGENVGEYTIVACATQYDGDDTCKNYYENASNFTVPTGKTLDEVKREHVAEFIVPEDKGSSNSFNASNYIVYTIPASITISTRNLTITPNSDQGFQYGNYVTGTVIDPITYYETSDFDYIDSNTAATESRNGLVNGGNLNSADSVNNQIAFCVNDITGKITCFNDRQNSTNGSIVGYITTTLRAASGYDPKALAGIHTTARGDGELLPEGAVLLNYNVYNDEYNSDNDNGEYARYALNRSLQGSDDQRYNRNVGEYVINAGELMDNRYCTDTITKNCLNTNYKVVAFTSNVKYVVTPADITVTPKADQNKIYGTQDVEITFDVVTTFAYKNPAFDAYHCATSNCQSTTSFGAHATVSGTTDKTITIDGFAYEENILASGTNIETDHNYGISRISNKTNSAQTIVSDYTTTLASPPADKGHYPKYFDKYCLGVVTGEEACYAFTTSVRYSYLTYEATSRILLGYFYIEEYEQSATKDSKPTLNIMNGIVVAKNEFGLVNYAYARTMDEDTGVDFTINKLKVDATIKDVAKVYGQATDMHKADDFTHTCLDGLNEVGCVNDHAVGMAANASLNNEGRLEYNFNVDDLTGSAADSVHLEGDVVILTQPVNGNYYTQTGGAETKNVHLGLSVVRAKNSTAASCLITSDKYGCEDAGTYTLVFRKVDVQYTVDQNYEITYGGNAGTLEEDSTLYAHVDTTTEEHDEGMGLANATISYVVYENAIEYIDAVTSAADAIDIIDGYSATLTIAQRSVWFYVGTYDANGVVGERYVIEQNEEVPEFPVLNSGFTTTTSSPTSKKIYYNTWFDVNEYGAATKEDENRTYAARQVRTADNVITTLSGDTHTLGVGICKTSTNSIQSAKYGEGVCESSNFVQYYLANTISGSSYVFDTSVVGNYAIIRNPDATYITYDSQPLTSAYEIKNYDTTDYNGTLVIYEDQTAPIIQVGNNNFAIEANAHGFGDSCTVVNSEESSYSYQCDVAGLRFTEENKNLGQIISYITQNYSDYGNNGTTRNVNAITSKAAFKLVDPFPQEVPGDWIYYPVNNTGNTASSDTLYKTERSDNTYAFADSGTNYIDTRLEAISSIISFYNINSYDYGYIRNSNYITKRYTPRYYFFIGKEVDNEIAKFDPTYVGEFEVTIYAIDNVGNQASVTVTLTITDTTQPLTGNMHLFNAPVICNSDPCATSSIDNWYVATGYVPISAFTKYKSNGTVDDVNGTHIMTENGLKGLYNGEVERYAKNSDGSFSANILGGYVRVESATTTKHIKATEIEHKYWFNGEDLYLVVVGGSDNSYIDSNDEDILSQWQTYYTVNSGQSWYKYDRHASVGTKITFKDGITDIYIRLMDEGRRFTKTTTADGNKFYNAVYLSYNGTCTGLGEGCTIIEGDPTVITQVKDLVMTPNKTSDVHEYKFTINALELTYNDSTNKVTWTGQTVAETVDAGAFNYGIMSCEISVNGAGNYEVDCETDYKLIYKSADYISLEGVSYAFVSDVNINDLDTTGLNGTNEEGNLNAFYKDRRYVYIDTTSPEIVTLNGDPFSLYEYKNKCQTGVSDDRCENSYEELFLSAKDKTVDTVAAAVVDSSAIAANVYAPSSYTSLGSISSTKILYTGAEYLDGQTSVLNSITSHTTKSSGLMSGELKIMYGTETYNNSDGAIDTTFNRHATDLVVYMTATKSGAEIAYYRFIAVFDGTYYRVYRQVKDSGDYPALTSLTISGADIASGKNLDTTEKVAEFIASTASISDIAALAGAYLDFSINYVIKDAAGNASVAVDNLTVRGVTYVRYESEVAFSIEEPAAANIAVSGDNSFTMTVNQGASIASILSGFVVSNKDYAGVNHVANLKQSLYYNGEAIFENIPYDQDIVSYINNLATAPGVYTLKVTNTREVDGKNGKMIIEDIPLVLNININPNVASTTSNNYTFAILAIISMILVPISIMGISYTKKRKKAE